MSRKNRLLGLGLGLSGLAALVGAMAPSAHGPGWVEHWYHRVPAFWAALGFCACWLLAGFSKGLGSILQRPEDPYRE